MKNNANKKKEKNKEERMNENHCRNKMEDYRAKYKTKRTDLKQ